MKRDMKNKFGQNGFLVDLIRRTEWWESSQQGTSVLRSLRKAGSRWWMEKQKIYFLRRSFIWCVTGSWLQEGVLWKKYGLETYVEM